MSKLTTDEVYHEIKNWGEPVTPTKLGIALGYDYSRASSVVNYHIKKLLAAGKIERLHGGKYKSSE